MTSPTTAQDSFGGTPTAPRPTATLFNVAMAMVLLPALPILVYYLWISLEFNHGLPAVPSVALLARLPAPTPASALIFVGWLGFHALLQTCLPGKSVEGTPIGDGSRLKYTMNGWLAWWLTWAMITAGLALRLFQPTILAEQFGPLLTTANLFVFVFCLYLYWFGKRRGRSGERVSGNPIYDFWLGTALNPRLGNFDLKLFFEARPGLIGWVAVDLSLAAEQQARCGAVTVPMILVCSFHFWYVADYYLHEEAILTTWDIKHENFGWMLCWGDLVWVPFTYTIQAYYLVEHTHDLPWWGATGIVFLNLVGYAIFRDANLQKHRFRKDPTRPIWGRPPRYIRTARGSLLLVSGWWGVARHMNYFGDLLMGLAWCLPCLFGSPLPYFYIFYFTILLVHRERRDHAMCARRYGDDWLSYCAQVPYRIVPGLY